jgi:hypothetical protein
MFFNGFNVLAMSFDIYTFFTSSLGTCHSQPQKQHETETDHLLCSNSFFIVPVAHFPWSVKGREQRAVTKTERETV